MTTERTSLSLELALLLALATLWGASYTFIKLGVATIPPVTLIAARTLIAGAVLLAVLRSRGLFLPRDAATWRRFMFQACLNSVVPFTLIAWAERDVDAGLATILNSTSPIFTFLLTAAVTRHEPVTARKLTGVVAGIVGTAIIVGTQALDGLGREVWAQLAIVAATICYAGAAIFGRGFKGLDPMMPAAGSMLCGAALLVPASLILDRPWTLRRRRLRRSSAWRCSRRRSPSASTSAWCTRSARSAPRRRPICACRSASASARSFSARHFRQAPGRGCCASSSASQP
jgi:drug/metabolite transporter (DMT)-like permease